MDFITTLIQFVIFLGLFLFFHEFGHFIVSRLFHIEVEEFGFGLPPRILRMFRIGKTDFTLNWIPFGAFVRPKGENDPEVPGGMASASPWVRLAVLLAGPAANILVGILLLVLTFKTVGMPNLSQVVVLQTTAGSPAQLAGLKMGDIILKVDQVAVDSIEKLQSTIQANLGKEITLTIRRSAQESTVKLTPRTNPPANEGPLGININNPSLPISWSQAVPSAVSAAYQQVQQLVTLPARLIAGKVPADQGRLVGVVGIFNFYSQANKLDAQAQTTNPTESAPIFRLSLIATISIALGFTNLLPIPALDGGRILFLLPELVIRRRIPARYENVVNMIGFAAVLLLMVIITIQDVINPIIPR